jgi:hypothetical protein
VARRPAAAEPAEPAEPDGPDEVAEPAEVAELGADRSLIGRIARVAS